MIEPMINGTAYSWSQIEIRLVDRLVQPLAGVTSIEYADEQKIEHNYGGNNMPVSTGYGNVVASGSITLQMDDIEAIRSNFTSGRLQDLGTFDITVTYLHPSEDKQVTHTLKNCYFNENGMSASQDDTVIEKQYNLNPTHILWSDNLVIGLGR